LGRDVAAFSFLDDSAVRHCSRFSEHHGVCSACILCVHGFVVGDTSPLRAAAHVLHGHVLLRLPHRSMRRSSSCSDFGISGICCGRSQQFPSCSPRRSKSQQRIAVRLSAFFFMRQTVISVFHTFYGQVHAVRCLRFLDFTAICIVSALEARSENRTIFAQET
jgi:hypothetical protein